MTRPHVDDSARDRGVSTGVILLLATACGIVVANLYIAQPIAGLLARDYGLPVMFSGIVVTVTQLGYAAGLVLVVPLGDIVENRRLILSLLALLVGALTVAFVAPNAALFILASGAIGITACAVQIMVPYAGHLATDEARGRVVGSVVSGLLLGIMLSRPLASFAAQFIGTHAIFALGAAVTILVALAIALWMPARRPKGMAYATVIASLWPLLRDTEMLHRRAAYQAAMFGAFSLFWTAVPLLLDGPRFHFTQIGIGVFALVGAGGALVSPFAGRAADAGHTHATTGLALGAGALSFLGALWGGLAGSWPLLVLAAFVLDMAVAANLVAGQREIFALGPDARSRLNGLFLALFFLGGAVGSFVAGLAFAHGGWIATCLAGFAFPLVAIGYFFVADGPAQASKTSA